MLILLTVISYNSFFAAVSTIKCDAIKQKFECCLSKGFNAPSIRRRAECMHHVNDQSGELLTNKEFYNCRLLFRRLRRRCNFKCQDVEGTCTKQELVDNQHCWKPMHKISGPENVKKKLEEIYSFDLCEQECLKAGSECQQLEYYADIKECDLSSTIGDLIDVSANNIVVETECYKQKGYSDCEMKSTKIHGNPQMSFLTGDPEQCAMTCSTLAKTMAFYLSENKKWCDCFKDDYRIEKIMEYGAKRDCF